MNRQFDQTHDSNLFAKKEEFSSLLFFLFFEIVAIPLKSFFIVEDVFSLSRFCLYQFFLVLVSLLLYFQIQKRTTISAAKIADEGKPNCKEKEEPVPESTSLTEEKLTTVDTTQLHHAEETVLFLQKRLEETDDERKELQKLCEGYKKEIVYFKSKVESLFSFSRQLAQDLKKQSALAEEDRKKHALEIRSLLMRETKIDEKNGNAGIFKRLSTNYPSSPSFQETSVESALSCLLTACQEALQKEQKGAISYKEGLQSQEWPSNAYPNLVKRKLYDSVIRLLRTDVGCTSLKNPTLELTLTSGFYAIKEELIDLIQKNQETLELLRDLEPYYITLNSYSLVFFRCTEEQISDVILFGIQTRKEM